MARLIKLPCFLDDSTGEPGFITRLAVGDNSVAGYAEGKSGIDHVLDTVFMFLLTKKGSNLIDSSYGTTIHEIISMRDFSDASGRIRDEVKRTCDYIKEKQSEELPPSEKLDSLEVLDIEQNDVGVITAKLHLTTAAGASAEFSI